MRNKSERLLEIRKIISREKIKSQEELLQRLRSNGFDMTQATLSRDLKYLRVSKAYDAELGYVYHLPEGSAIQESHWSNFLIEGFQSIEFAQGLVIIRTLPGYASGIASAIDSMNMVEVAGTIAGDDTILIIPRDGTRKEDIVQQLSAIIPGI